ncbi:MAG: dihydroorotate dehydrogenase electron transfer subunit [Oscillospiraceae bacterium]|nr:dihydroorotate dehydrogenase electron transfer subunit [Oscillospiraceae bacterium]
MKQGIFDVAENRPLSRRTMELRLEGDASSVTAPGQFIDVRLESRFLRRPFSVCDADAGSVTVLYDVVGRGTEELKALPVGTRLDVLTGLGNGFDLSIAGEAPLLIGGGTGASPLYLLAKELRRQGKAVRVILGFPTAAECYYEEKFRALGCAVTLVTAAGNRGETGLVTDHMVAPHSAFYACGAEEMLKAVCRLSPAPGQISLGQRLGCGFGACMGCTIRTAAGLKRLCTEGPVLNKEELLWDD